MGGSISALFTNTFGELKGEEEAEEEMLRKQKKRIQKPGHVRIGLRRLRDFVVVGRGKELLPQGQDDLHFEPISKDKQEEELKSVKVDGVRRSRRGSTTSAGSHGSVANLKKKIKIRYHRTEANSAAAIAASTMAISQPTSGTSFAKRKMSMAVGLGRNKSVVEHEKAQHKAKLTKLAKDKKIADHKKRIAEAMGCRRQVDEIMFVMLICIYLLILGWSCAIYPKLVDTDPQYDYANDAWYVHECTVGFDNLKTWWRMNVIWTGSMVCLVIGIEIFYYFIAPYSPFASLSTFSKGFARSVVILCWLALILIWLMVGSYWFFGEAERATCGHLNVDHARGLLIMQYAWLVFHFLVFTSNFDNRMALKRRWCLASNINTALVKEWKSAKKATEESDAGSSNDGEVILDGVDLDHERNVQIDSEGSTSGDEDTKEEATDDEDDITTDDEGEDEEEKKMVIFAKKDVDDTSTRITFRPGSSSTEISKRILSAFPNIDGEQVLSEVTTLQGDKMELSKLSNNETYLVTTTLVID
eukprot:TRINITY_DN21842_c0_g1_i1.p1 TRINITY_DN21842_c0_g1~~TRINITY_DN21842_c0_g1_i1.p1  ORF type:complete len:529 (+),score=110.49 TRINITY_DN21842_c0_g1_i1:59-1645(+)